MKLFWSGASPYARKTLIVAHELGLADKIEIVTGSGTPIAPNPQTTAYNPLGKLPCLVPDDGPAIYDSRVICQYLTSLAADQKLLAAEGAARWRTLTLEALGDGLCDAGLLIQYEKRVREEGHRSQAWVDGQMGKIDRALDVLENVWASHLAGPFDLGHAAVGAAVGYLDYRFADKDWRTGRPALAGWMDKFNARESAAATAPTG